MFKTTGFISFALRRFTGVVLVLYLLVHIWVIGAALQGESAAVTALFQPAAQAVAQ